MNLMHLKYMLAVAETGSINKAAEKLYVGQPNLSRAIRELENSLGGPLFDRSAKGMVLTPEGEIFLKYARGILKQVEEAEAVFRKAEAEKKQFSISVPRASYIADAFARFTVGITAGETELFYKETNAMRAIKNILQEDYRLGIIRYADSYDKYYKALLDEKNLSYELVTEFSYVLLMNREHPLADKPELCYADLEPYMEIAHADPYVPSLPQAQVKKEELPDNIHRRIYVFERASQFELLAQNPQTLMWVSPVPQELLDRYGLIQRVCPENQRRYKDLLIHRRDYQLTELDKSFISELCQSRRRIFG